MTLSQKDFSYDSLGVTGKVALLLALASVMSEPFAGNIKILECKGIHTTLSKDAPANVALAEKEMATQVYELSDEKLRIKVAGIFKDQIFNLCSKSESEYIFSNNCDIDPRTYVKDWVAEEDHLANAGKSSNSLVASPFFAKYQSLGYGSLDVVTIDRVNLRVLDISRMPFASGSVKKHGYMVTDSFDLTCILKHAKL